VNQHSSSKKKKKKKYGWIMDDKGKMPVTLKDANYTLCAQLCDKTPSCKYWAFGIPGCDSYKTPQCWLKFFAGEMIPFLILFSPLLRHLRSSFACS